MFSGGGKDRQHDVPLSVHRGLRRALLVHFFAVCRTSTVAGDGEHTVLMLINEKARGKKLKPYLPMLHGRLTRSQILVCVFVDAA